MGPETEAFLTNCWYVAAWDHELIDGKLLARTVLEKPLVLYKGESGRAVALDNRCAHRGAKLSNGRLEGDCVLAHFRRTLGKLIDAERGASQAAAA